jgi:hypothetical protein
MDSSNRRRTLVGTCTAILAATLLVNAVSTFLSDGKPPTHNEIAAAGFLAVLHVGLTIAAVFGITQLVRRKADRLGLFGAALTLLGATVGARIMVLLQLVLLSDKLPGVHRATLKALLESAPLVWVSIIPIGLMYPLGLITLGTALLIARPVNRWIGVLMVIGGVLFPIGRALDVNPAIYASDAIMAITYGFLSWEILTRRELWDESLVTTPEQRSDREYGPVAQMAR